MDKVLHCLVLISIAFGAVRCQGGGLLDLLGGAGGGTGGGAGGGSLFDMLFGMFSDNPVQYNTQAPAADAGMTGMAGMGGTAGLPIDINLLQSQIAGGQSGQSSGMSYYPGLPTGMQGGLQGMQGLQGSGLNSQEMMLASLLSSAGRKGGSRGSGGEGEGGAGGGEGGAGGGEGGAGGGEGGAGGEEGGAGGSSSGMPSFKDLLRLNMMQAQSRNRMTSQPRNRLQQLMPQMNQLNPLKMASMGMGMGGGRNGLGSMGNLGMSLGMQSMANMMRGKLGGRGGGGGEGGEGGAAGGAGGEGGGARGGGEGGARGGGEGGAGAAGGEGGGAQAGGEGGGRSGMEWALLALKNPQFRRMSGSLLNDFTSSIFRMVDGVASTMGVPLGGLGRRKQQSPMSNALPFASPPKNMIQSQRYGASNQNSLMANTKLAQNDLRSLMMSNELSKNMPSAPISSMRPPFGMPMNPGSQFPDGSGMAAFRNAWTGMMRKSGQMTPTGSRTAWMAGGMQGTAGTSGSGDSGLADQCPEFPYVVQSGKVVFKDINLNCQLSVDLQSTSAPPTMVNTGIVPLTSASTTPQPTPVSGTSGDTTPNPQSANPLARMESKGDTIAMCPPWKVWRRDREIHIETVPSKCHIIVTSMRNIPGIQGSNSVQVRFANRGPGQTPRAS